MFDAFETLLQRILYIHSMGSFGLSHFSIAFLCSLALLDITFLFSFLIFFKY
jgi:hypothetical protein